MKHKDTDNISKEELYMTKLTMFMNGLLDVKAAAVDMSKDRIDNDASKVAREEIVKRLKEIIDVVQ